MYLYLSIHPLSMYMCIHVGISAQSIHLYLSIYLLVCVYTADCRSMCVCVCVCVCVYSRHSAHSRGNFRAISVQPVKGDHRRRDHRRVCCRMCSIRICSLRMCCLWMCCLWNVEGYLRRRHHFRVRCIYRMCSV
jgi:hypothetical protein